MCIFLGKRELSFTSQNPYVTKAHCLCVLFPASSLAGDICLLLPLLRIIDGAAPLPTLNTFGLRNQMIEGRGMGRCGFRIWTLAKHHEAAERSK